MTQYEFIENQCLSMDTVLSYRARVTDISLRTLVTHVIRNTDALNLNIKGNVAFSFIIDFKQSNKSIYSIELLIPVDNAFESDNYYVLKPHFRLENAVKIRHFGRFEDLQITKKKLMQYLIENNLQPITNVYYSVVKYSTDNLSDNIIDVYIGVNGNIL